MSRIAEESIQKVAAANDIVTVIGSYIPLKAAGSDFKAHCPFHKEKSPSFSVSPSRQVYHCFGCGVGGGVIRFVMEYEHLSFVDAVRKLAQSSGIHLIEENGNAENGPSKNERNRLLEIHREAAAWFHRQLLKDMRAQPARDYLRSRKMTQEVATRWLLGYAPAEYEEFLHFARKYGFSDEELVKSGLCGRSEKSNRLYDRFRDRVMIPIYNDFGEVVAFSGRILNPAASPAKYVNSPETPIFTKGKLLFGLNKSKRALIDRGCAIVCEGQFDLITAFENGVENVIAPQGTAFTSHQATLLRRFVQTVILCFDADLAGQKAVERSLPSLLGNGLAVKVLELPKGDDPDSMIRREGKEAFLEKVLSAKEIIDYQLSLAETSGVLTDPRGLAETARHIASILCLIPDLVQREAAAMQVASHLSIAPKRMFDLLRTNRPAPEAIEDTPIELTTAPMPLPEACAFLCRLAFSSLEARQWLAEQTNPSPKDFGDPWPILEEILKSDFSPHSGTAVASFLATCSPQVQSTLAALDIRHQPVEMLQSAQTTWQALRYNFLFTRQEEIKMRLRKKNLSAKEISEIQKELLDLRQRLQEIAIPKIEANRS